MKVLLNSAEKLMDFVNSISPYETRMDFVSSRYIVNAQSVLSLLNLDLSRPIEFIVHDTGKPSNRKEIEQIYCIARRYQTHRNEGMDEDDTSQ